MNTTAKKRVSKANNNRFNNFRFINITPDVWKSIQTKLHKAMDGNIPDRGNVRGRGFRINWKYDRMDEMLEVMILEKPSFISSSALNIKMLEFIDTCRKIN